MNEDCDLQRESNVGVADFDFAPTMKDAIEEDKDHLVVDTPKTQCNFLQ